MFAKYVSFLADVYILYDCCKVVTSEKTVSERSVKKRLARAISLLTQITTEVAGNGGNFAP